MWKNPQAKTHILMVVFLLFQKKQLNISKESKLVGKRKLLKNWQNQIMAFKHHGFWHSIRYLRDKNNLENYWKK